MLTTIKPIYSTDERSIKKIQDILSKVSTISPYAFFSYKKKVIKKVAKKKKTKRVSDENSSKNLHIFFDIDSTLTHGGISAISREVKSVFDQFKAHSCALYFCTGRAYQVVKRLTQRYGFGHEYGIAENGGIILGMGDADSGHKHGDNTEPKKVLTHLKKNRIPFMEDPNQRNRKTEIVIDLTSISPRKIKNEIHNLRAKVECHKSKQAYHITKKGINKGSAIEVLTSEELELDSRNDKVIGVGDSELDLKMFEYCNEGYLVPSNDKQLKKKIQKDPKLRNKVHFLRETAPYSVAELYKQLFPFG